MTLEVEVFAGLESKGGRTEVRLRIGGRVPADAGRFTSMKNWR